LLRCLVFSLRDLSYELFNRENGLYMRCILMSLRVTSLNLALILECCGFGLGLR
jgi:hypothetical protein